MKIIFRILRLVICEIQSLVFIFMFAIVGVVSPLTITSLLYIFQ